MTRTIEMTINVKKKKPVNNPSPIFINKQTQYEKLGNATTDPVKKRKKKLGKINLPNQACCSPCTSMARPKSANLTAAPLALLANNRFSGWTYLLKNKNKNKQQFVINRSSNHHRRSTAALASAIGNRNPIKSIKGGMTIGRLDVVVVVVVVVGLQIGRGIEIFAINWNENKKKTKRKHRGIPKLQRPSRFRPPPTTHQSPPSAHPLRPGAPPPARRAPFR